MLRISVWDRSTPGRAASAAGRRGKDELLAQAAVPLYRVSCLVIVTVLLYYYYYYYYCYYYYYYY